MYLLTVHVAAAGDEALSQAGSPFRSMLHQMKAKPDISYLVVNINSLHDLRKSSHMV